jgi:hypothetical protein
MRFTIAATVIALFAAGLTAADDKKYESKEGKYAVAFPSTPKLEMKKSGDLDLNIAVAELGMGGFAVVHATLPAEFVKARKPKDLLDSGQKGLVDNFKATVITSKDIEFGSQKFPAREIYAEKDATHLRITIILADDRLYQIFVVGPKELITSKDAEDFSKSLEIMK